LNKKQSGANDRPVVQPGIGPEETAVIQAPADPAGPDSAVTARREIPETPSSQAPPIQEPLAPAARQAEPAQPASRQEIRERTIYFSQVDRSGIILRVSVNRNLPVSDTPLIDALNALIEGTTAEENNRGLISLIPSGTRLLSARVSDSTAFISFSEEFQFNSYGVDGYAGQLKQVIYTATEFSGVRDVQILIDGRRVDFLGEGIWIGSPLNRERP